MSTADYETTALAVSRLTLPCTGPQVWDGWDLYITPTEIMWEVGCYRGSLHVCATIFGTDSEGATRSVFYARVDDLPEWVPIPRDWVEDATDLVAQYAPKSIPVEVWPEIGEVAPDQLGPCYQEQRDLVDPDFGRAGVVYRCGRCQGPWEQEFNLYSHEEKVAVSPAEARGSRRPGK